MQLCDEWEKAKTPFATILFGDRRAGNSIDPRRVASCIFVTIVILNLLSWLGSSLI
jgi:hypothetical protein